MTVNMPENNNNNNESPSTEPIVPVGQESEVIESPVEELKGHPAWQEILDVLPESLHSVVKPNLLEWDKGVQDKITSVRDEYSAYEDFRKNEIPSETIEQSLWLLQNLQDDPEKVVKEIIEAWGFQDKFNTAQQEVVTPTEPVVDPDDDSLDNFDITKHPDFLKMQETVNQMQSETTSQKEAKATEDATAQIDKQIEDLHTKHGEFDDMFVLAYMTQGQDGATAVKQYQDSVNQAAARIASTNKQTNEPDPVIMGGNSATGSGIATEPTDFSKMKSSQREDLVAELLNKRSQ